MYEAIVSSTLEILSQLPVPVPAEGRLAGIIHEYKVSAAPMSEGDNLHFTLGTTYLKMGVRGVAKKAAENESPQLRLLN